MVQVKKLKDGSRQVILTTAQFDEITKVLTELAAKTKASTILLADISGCDIHTRNHPVRNPDQSQRSNTEYAVIIFCLFLYSPLSIVAITSLRTSTLSSSEIG